MKGVVITMKTKRVLAIMTSIVLFVSVVGCSNNSAASIPKPTIPMKIVTQNSDEDFITFECLVPDNWIVFSTDYITVGGVDNSNLEKEIKTEEEKLPFVFKIKRYTALSGSDTNKMKRIIEELFAGNPTSYLEEMNSYIASLNQQTFSNKQYISNFQYQCYKGKNGKIMEVRYSYPVIGKTYHAVDYFLEDIPYVVSGGYDESLKLSSGDIALWVADSLKVTEHFTMEKGGAVKKG